MASRLEFGWSLMVLSPTFPGLGQRKETSVPLGCAGRAGEARPITHIRLFKGAGQYGRL